MYKRPKETFFQRRQTDGQQALSTSLIIGEMQIKIIMRYHITLVRMTIIKKNINNKSW